MRNITVAVAEETHRLARIRAAELEVSGLQSTPNAELLVGCEPAARPLTASAHTPGGSNCGPPLRQELDLLQHGAGRLLLLVGRVSVPTLGWRASRHEVEHAPKSRWLPIAVGRAVVPS